MGFEGWRLGLCQSFGARRCTLLPFGTLDCKITKIILVSTVQRPNNVESSKPRPIPAKPLNASKIIQFPNLPDGQLLKTLLVVDQVIFFVASRVQGCEVWDLIL